MQKSIKMADALFSTADAVSALAKLAGLKVDTTKLYGKERIKELALTTKFLMELVNACSEAGPIEVTRD